MIKAPELDWNEIEAARVRSRKLRSEAWYNVFAAIGNAIASSARSVWHMLAGNKTTTKPSLVQRGLNFAREKSPLERGLQAGWY